MIELYIVELPDKIDDNVYTKLLESLNDEDIIRIKKFRFMEDTYRCLVADVIVRYILCKKLNVGNRQLKFRKNAYGKPYIEKNNFYFNKSHSGSFVMCGVSDKEIGVDVEKIKEIDIGIAQRFFNNHEYAMFSGKDKNEQQDLFFNLWTLKESFIKAEGKGMSIPLKSFRIVFEKEGLITAKLNEKETEYNLKQYFIHEGYKSAVCAKSKCLPNELIRIELKQLIKEYLQMI